jgi:hypothetical protein
VQFVTAYEAWTSTLAMGMVQHRHADTKKKKKLENFRRAHSADRAMKGYIS